MLAHLSPNEVRNDSKWTMHHPLTTRALGTASQIHSPEIINPSFFNVKIKLYFINYELKSDYCKNIQSNPEEFNGEAQSLTRLNPLVPSVDFLDIFPLFSVKKKVLLSTMSSVRRKKLKADISRIFFWFFYDDLKVFFKAKKIFLEIFGKFDGEHLSGAHSPSWDHYTSKSSARHFYL